MDSVHLLTLWWRHHGDVSDENDLLECSLVKLVPAFYLLCLGHCMSHCQYVGKVAECNKILLLLLPVGFGDFFSVCVHSVNPSFVWY